MKLPFSKIQSENEAIKQQAVTCKSKLDSAASFSADCQAQIAGKEIIISRLQQENKDAADRKLELSNMDKWKSEKEAAESQMNRLRSENQRLASFERRYNLLLKSEFY